MRDYFKLLRYIRPYLGKFFLGAVCMGFSAIFDGVQLAMIVPVVDRVFSDQKIVVPTQLPAFLADFVEKINNTAPLTVLNYIAIGIVILFIFKGIFGFLQSYLMSDIGQSVVRDIRGKLYAKMQTLSLEYFTHKRGGELVSRITNDVKLVENAVSYGSTDLIYQGMQIIVLLTLAFFIYLKFALIFFIMVPFIAIPIVRVGKILRKLSHRGQEKMADINSLLVETISGTRIVKAFNMEDYEVDRFQQANQEYYKISMKSIKRLLIISPVTELMGCIAGILIFSLGMREVLAGTLSAGVFGVFLGALLSLIRPFKKLSQVHSLNQQAIAASTRIHDVLEAVSSVKDKKGAPAISSFQGKIAYDNIWFNYGDNQILNGINLEVKKGQMLAIVGPSGVGKTTLLDLIPRFYDPEKGRILIDGKDIKEVSLKSLRRLIGIVTQETFLFNDTIRANIAYGKLETSDKEIEKAATLAHAHEFITNFSSGYDTVIGDRGMKLSGGERQRIAIARALLKDPPILILDEATSQLDTRSERIVQDALDTLVCGRTVLVIAHRLSTVQNAQRIIVLQDGVIAEEGDHRALLAKGGLYKKLYQMQELQ